MSHLVLQAVTLLAAVIIITRAEPALNRMSRSTPIMLRLAIHLLAVGALSEIACIAIAGEVPSWSTAIITVGIAAMLVCERRLRVLCPPPRRNKEPSL